nr:hypothetical protein BgiMline_002329 [Biomphalaria glabrata]
MNAIRRDKLQVDTVKTCSYVSLTMDLHNAFWDYQIMQRLYRILEVSECHSVLEVSECHSDLEVSQCHSVLEVSECHSVLEVSECHSLGVNLVTVRCIQAGDTSEVQDKCTQRVTLNIEFNGSHSGQSVTVIS